MRKGRGGGGGWASAHSLTRSTKTDIAATVQGRHALQTTGVLPALVDCVFALPTDQEWARQLCFQALLNMSMTEQCCVALLAHDPSFVPRLVTVFDAARNSSTRLATLKLLASVLDHTRYSGIHDQRSFLRFLHTADADQSPEIRQIAATLRTGIIKAMSEP